MANNHRNPEQQLVINLATWLTASRVILAPFFAFAFLRAFSSAHPIFWLWSALAIAIVSEITDGLDGAIARLRHEVTDFGKVFDPMADSMACLTVFLCFMIVGIIPWWIFLVFFYRESSMSLLRVTAASKGTVQGARLSGKVKTSLQSAGIIIVLGICISHAYGIVWVPREFLGRHLGFWVMLVPTAASVLSLLDYIHPNRTALAKMMEPIQ